MKTHYTRERILEESEFLEFDDFFVKDIQYYLTKYVFDFDVELVELLLKLGGDPNIHCYNQYGTRNDGFLHSLIHEFYNQYTLKGESILQVSELLLEFGANPNLPGSCNTAPIQYCNSELSAPFEKLLLQYGARPEGNPRI